MPRLTITPTCYLETRQLATVAQLPAFVEQRELDPTRVPPIVHAMERQLTDTNHLTLDTPIVLVECAQYDEFLLDTQQLRVSTAIVDGQHRAQALRTLLHAHPQCATLDVPVYVHVVDTLHAARDVQYRLFEQKPVDHYDRLHKSDYHLSDILHALTAHYRQHHPAIAKRHFKDGRYTDKHIRPRRLHFMLDEFAHHVKNSSNVHLWQQREIQCDELVHALGTLVTRQCTALRALPTDAQQQAVGITKRDNYRLFEQFLTRTPFQILPYVYFRKYELLVHDVEEVLGLAHDALDEFEECC